MKQDIITYLILATITLVGCKKHRLESDLPNDPSRVSFGISITGGYSQSQIKTRGTPQTGSAAYENKRITVMAFDQTSATGAKRDFTTLLSKGGDGWVPDPAKYYDGLTYNFYAYASDLEITPENNYGITIIESSTPTISYTVPSDVTKQPDILIGDMVENKSSGEVTLSMYHALSCVGFVATSKHTGNIRKVRSVTIKNVYGKGSTTLAKNSDSPIVWSVSGDADLTFIAGMNEDQPLDDKLEDINNNLTYLMNGNGYLMMVPQELPMGAQIVIEIWDGVNETSVHTIDYDIPPTTWEPGKRYMYYFDEPILEGVATYYERYADGTLGLYYCDEDILVLSTLKDNSPITDAGYGLLVPASTYTQYPSIYLGLVTGGDDPKDESTSDGSIVAMLNTFGDVECVLYPLSQDLYPYSRTSTSRTGFQPYNTGAAVKIESGVSKTGSGKPINTHGYILPHYAKGIYTTDVTPTDYAIRTPIQMRNISYQTDNTNLGITNGKNYNQEFVTLDFSIHSDRFVYGKDVKGSSSYKESIVIGGFGGTYGSQSAKSIIAGLIINTPVNYQYNTALFESVMPNGRLINVETAASCIYVYNSTTTSEPRYLAGIAAENSGVIDGAVNNAAITCNSDNDVRVGGVAGLNAYRVKNSKNYGVINNQGRYFKSATGGVVAWNEKWYSSWATAVKEEEKEIFRSLYRGEFTASMIDTYPGAVVSNCENYARVMGAARTGGVAGINAYGGVIFECDNNNEVRNNGKLGEEIILGGIVGLQTGGLENNNETNPTKIEPPQFICTIQNCINTGNITAISGLFEDNNRAVGGIVGINDFATATGDGYEIEAYGHVNQCVVEGARVSGFYSDAGGIAGLNSGSVNRSRCENVYVGGVFGNGDSKKRNSAGGIVGTNNTYVGDCLFTHSSTFSSPISSEPIWVNRSSSGGIVGINNTPDAKLKSPSSFIQRCIFSAIAPATRTVGGEIGTFAPIAGWSGGYLFRHWNGNPNLVDNGVDATTGATPLYTIQDNYYASGAGVNNTDGNVSFPNEPDAEVEKFGPFKSGRYPYGQARLSNDDIDILPLDGWFGAKWSARPPIVPSWYNQSYTLPQAGGSPYILAGIVREIKNQTGAVKYTAPAWGFANSVRVSLNYMTTADLANITSIECDFSAVTLLPNNAGDNGFLFIRTPDNWKFDANQNNPKPYRMTVTGSAGSKTYYYCLITETSGKIIKMIP